MAITAEEILAEIGPVQEVLDQHDGIVNVMDTSDGNIMLSLEGGCTGCSSNTNDCDANILLINEIRSGK